MLLILIFIFIKFIANTDIYKTTAAYLITRLLLDFLLGTVNIFAYLLDVLLFFIILLFFQKYSDSPLKWFILFIGLAFLWFFGVMRS